MGHAPPRRGAFAHVLLALLVALTATACGGASKAITPSAPSISAVPTDPDVAATGLPTDVKVDVTDSSPGDEVGDNLDYVSPIYTVTPIGPLDQAATFTLQLDNALPANTPIVVATRPFERSEWSYQRGQISDDQQHVDFRATTLDQVAVLSLDRDGALSTLRSDVRTNLFPKQAKKKAAQPTCAQSTAAHKDGYKTDATRNRTLSWCFGLLKAKRVVTITNRRVVPVEVAHVHMKAVTTPPTPSAYAVWPTILGTTRTLLGPGRTATYDAELAPKARVKVVAASTSRAQALRVLQASSRAFVMRLNDFGAGPERPTASLAGFLDAPRCVRAVKLGVHAVVKHCFTPRQLHQVFGSKALLLEPLLAGRYSSVFFGRLGKRLATEAKNQRETVYVHRVAPKFTALVGLWSGKSRLLGVNAQGVVTETLQDSGKLVVKLTYQLAEPVAKGGSTTAAATLTAVKVGNRKLLNGRVPRVGDKGTITLRKGVITPPYLKTTYCDGTAAKKGTCDS